MSIDLTLSYDLYRRPQRQHEVSDPPRDSGSAQNLGEGMVRMDMPPPPPPLPPGPPPPVEVEEIPLPPPAPRPQPPNPPPQEFGVPTAVTPRVDLEAPGPSGVQSGTERQRERQRERRRQRRAKRRVEDQEARRARRQARKAEKLEVSCSPETMSNPPSIASSYISAKGLPSTESSDSCEAMDYQFGDIEFSQFENIPGLGDFPDLPPPDNPAGLHKFCVEKKEEPVEKKERPQAGA